MENVHKQSVEAQRAAAGKTDAGFSVNKGEVNGQRLTPPAQLLFPIGAVRLD